MSAGAPPLSASRSYRLQWTRWTGALALHIAHTNMEVTLGVGVGGGLAVYIASWERTDLWRHTAQRAHH